MDGYVANDGIVAVVDYGYDNDAIAFYLLKNAREHHYY